MIRLESLVKRLKKAGKLDDYDAIIKEQLQEGIIEEAPLAATGQEFYIPHKAVVRESAETTKMRIVHDASAKARDSAPSLNDCLEAGPPLQNQLWKVLLRGKFHAFALTGDIRRRSSKCVSARRRSLSLPRESGLKGFCYHGRHCGGQGSNINRHGALTRARRSW